MRELNLMLTPPPDWRAGAVLGEGPVNEDGVPLSRANDPAALAQMIPGLDLSALGG